MGSDESHLNVSVGSDGQSHKTVSTYTTFEEKGGPSAYQPNVLPLGQIGSLALFLLLIWLLYGQVLGTQTFTMPSL